MAKLKVWKTKSGIGSPPNQRATLIALGLRKMHAAVVHEDSQSIRGMIRTVTHLVKVEELK